MKIDQCAMSALSIGCDLLTKQFPDEVIRLELELKTCEEKFINFDAFMQPLI